MRQLIKLHYYAVQILAGFTALCVVFLIVAIGAEAIIRSLGWGYVPGVIDLSEFSLFFIAVLAAPWLLRENRHIRVDIVVANLHPNLRYRVEKLIFLIILGITATIFFYSCQVLMDSWRLKEMLVREVEIPDWWLQWQIPLAMFLMSIEMIQRLFFPHCRYEPKKKSWLDADEPVDIKSAQGGE